MPDFLNEAVLDPALQLHVGPSRMEELVFDIFSNPVNRFFIAFEEIGVGLQQSDRPCFLGFQIGHEFEDVEPLLLPQGWSWRLDLRARLEL